MNKGCADCTFNWPNGKKKIPYCVLRHFAILNPNIGCSKKITRTITPDLIIGDNKETNDEVDDQERFDI